MNIKQKLTTLLLLAVGAVTQLSAQTAVTVGSQVTSESNLSEGVPYIIYQPRNSSYIKEASDRYSAIQSNSPDDTGVFFFVKVSDGIYKIKSYSTGKFISKPTTTGIAAIAPVEEASAGEWNLQFDSNGCIYPLCNGYGWDRGSNALWATAGASTNYSESGNVKLYKIYEVALSTTVPFSDFTDKDISVSASEAASISEGQWYVMKNRGRNGYAYEDNGSMRNQGAAPGGSATGNAKFLVRFLSAGNGKYYLQNGLSNFWGAIPQNTAVPATALGTEKYTVGKINSTDGHFYLTSETDGIVLDCQENGNPVVGWGTTIPTSIGGNNDWAFYPVEFVESWTPAIDEVYTINNTNANRGALIYNSENPTYVWSSGKSGTFNASQANSQWVIIPTETALHYYIYNVGAGKFAIPSGIANGAGSPWVFSDNAVAMTFETQGNGTKKIKMATNPVSGTNAAYISVSNGQTNPIINYNDAGSEFTITKVDGVDASTAANAANAAVAKLVKNQTALTTYPQTTGWYAIQIKSKDNTPSYAGRYLQNATSLYNDLYPLTFTGAIDVQPAITDPTFFTHINCTSWDVNTWQLPDGRFLVNNGSNKFPTPSATAGNVICGYDNGNYFKEANNYYADPYNSNANYFIGETTYKRTSYTVYPIDLTAAGLVAWKLILEGLEASTMVTCTRSDVRGLPSVYNNGYFFLPTGITPNSGDFTASIGGTTVSLNADIDTDAKTISVSFPLLTINSPMAEATFTWNGVSKTGKTVEFPYMGGTITDPTITVSYSGNEFSSPTLSQSTWDGTVSTTVTCTMTPAFFSSSYGEKWIRIGNALGGGTVMGLSTCVSGETVKMKTLDYFDEAQLWCFVGSLESFNIYNKKAGQSLQMASSSTTITNDVTAVMLAAGSAATEWKLMNKLDASNGPGWAIHYSNHDGSRALNAKGGIAVGNTVGYYNNGDGNGGSRWLFSDANGQVTLAMSGLNAESMTEYTKDIAAMPITINGTSSENLITKDNFGTLTFYVPMGSELTFGTPKMFLNYAFSSLSDNTVTASSTPQTVNISFTTAHSDARYLWGPLRQNNSDYYRIPAIVTAKDGDILAINDRRFGHAGDLGIGGEHHIDLIGVASSDNGATWSEEFMVMDGTGSGATAGYGDAAVVADRESNQVLVMACGGNVSYPSSTSSNHQSIARVVLSKTGGRWTASSITNVAEYFYAGELASSAGMFIGSGSITQSSIIKKGTHYRVYCAVLARDDKNYALYSDDFGQTWTLMGSVAANNNEAKVAELPDGSVLLSVRKSYGRTFNVWTWDDESYTSGSWGTAVNTNNQTGGISFDNNSTNGDIRTIPAIKKATGEVVTLAMQSVPTGNGRSKVSLFYKELDPTVTYTPTTIAQNWSSAYQVTPYNSAYSSFNAQADGRIAFFMEEAPRTMVEANVGYYMCYVPLTLDEITDNQYTGVASNYPLPLNVVGDKSYATLYLPFDVTTTDATKAYYVETASNGSVQLTETSGEGTEIPAHTAVVLVNSDGAASTILDMTSGLASVVSEGSNLLKGTLVPMSLDLSDATNFYSLGKVNDEIGFYKFAGGTISLGANKAYLEVPASGDVKGFTFDFDEDATGISDLLNGQWSMVNGQSIFNLSGQRLSKPVKGINIINGKKVLR